MGNIYNTNAIGTLYGMKVTTGSLSGVSAASDTLGHLGTFCWRSTAKACYVQRIKAVWRTTTGFTAAQGLGLDMSIIRGFTADPSGGTKVVGSLAAVGIFGFKRWAKQPDSLITSVWIATTTGLTAGTFTPAIAANLDILAQGWGYAPAAAANVTSTFTCERDFAMNGEDGLRLEANEGILLRNVIAMGAVGTSRVDFAVDWIEATI
jgi:hypothetical protein